MLNVCVYVDVLDSGPWRGLGRWIWPPRKRWFGAGLLLEADGLLSRHGEPHQSSHTLFDTWWYCAVTMGTRSAEIWAGESDGRHWTEGWSGRYRVINVFVFTFFYSCRQWCGLLLQDTSPSLYALNNYCDKSNKLLFLTQKALISTEFTLLQSMVLGASGWWCGTAVCLWFLAVWFCPFQLLNMTE